MSLENHINAGEEDEAPVFEIGQLEAAVIYIALYINHKCAPDREIVMDKLAQMEAKPEQRAAFDIGLGVIEDLLPDLRDFLVSCSGEESVKVLEEKIMTGLAAGSGAIL